MLIKNFFKNDITKKVYSFVVGKAERLDGGARGFFKLVTMGTYQSQNILRKVRCDKQS